MDEQNRILKSWEVTEKTPDRMVITVYRSWKHFAPQVKKDMRDAYLVLGGCAAIFSFYYLLPVKALRIMIQNGSPGPVDPVRTAAGVAILLLLALLPFLLAKLPPYYIIARPDRIMFRNTEYPVYAIDRMELKMDEAGRFSRQFGVMRLAGRTLGLGLRLHLKDGTWKCLKMFGEDEAEEVNDAMADMARIAGILYIGEDLE